MWTLTISLSEQASPILVSRGISEDLSQGGVSILWRFGNEVRVMFHDAAAAFGASRVWLDSM